jgi:hypothetical protein
MSLGHGDELGPLGVLRRRPPPPPPEQRCDLCAEPIGEVHRHVVDLEGQRLLCTCYGCGLLFSPEGAGGGRYRAVPDRYVKVASGPGALALWEALEVPVGVVFFLVSSKTGRISAFYPGPAGATESLLTLESWQEALSQVPAVAAAAPDVEAVLLRVGEGRQGAECFIVPVDACYELAGRMRQLWRGFDGGAEARKALEEFFAEVRAKCR